MAELTLRPVTGADLDRCFEIETAAFTGDEAASKEKIQKRINTYPEGFVIIENNKEVIGFINSGATDNVELSDEEFKELVGHDSGGRHIVILSVAVHPDFQRQGMAGCLMADFLSRMRSAGKSDVFLICQTELIPMYAKFGFVDLGASDSDHGGMSWNEMRLSLIEA